MNLLTLINLRLAMLLLIAAVASTGAPFTQSIAAAQSGTNVALAANGGVATSSSNFSAGTAPAGAINGDRKGLNWNNGGGWKSAAGLPQSLQVQFAGQRTIDRVVVYDVQDNYTNPVEPTDTMTNPLYGSSFIDFTVSVWNGASFIVVATVTNNALVKRTVTFPAVSTDRVQVTVTRSADAYARLAEIEAFTPGQVGPSPTTTTLASSLNPAQAGASVTFTATVNGTTPTGNVGFTDNGNAIAGCTAVALTGAGNSRTAACTTSSLGVGTHPITASYGGDAGNAPSASTPLSQVITAPQGSINVALAANGGVATSSSNFSTGTAPAGAINGDRKGLNWNNGGGWKSAAGLPQSLQVQFAGQRTIDRVVVYDVQDNYTNPVEPTDTMTNPLYGSSFIDFTVSVWNGASFIVVATVTNNALVKRTVTFPAVSTDRVQVTVTRSADAYARLAEIEVWGVTEGGVPGNAAWSGFGRDAQHTALSTTASQPLNRINWQMPVDLQPQYSGNGSLLIHYGSPVITSANTVIVPVKTGATSGFRVEARVGSNGALQWSMNTDYILPSASWTPPYGPVLTSQSRLYFPGAGGTIYFRDQVDAATGTSGQIAFYGLANYQANPQAYNAGVIINTPLTADSSGNVYFGFQVTGGTPLGLTSGIARISAGGQGTWTPVTTAAADANMTKVPHNSAPALSADQRVLYVAASNGAAAGYLLALDSATLAPLTRVRLIDPKSGQDALLSDNGTASPTVGTDGDVYFGVRENPFGSNHARGWLLHFNGNLSQTKTPGAFGWDTTASLVPATMVPSYQGASAYLLMSKYNHYLGLGGDGQNRIAILDPNATQTDFVTGATVMKEVLTILGPTPEAGGGVKEWCINTAAVDPFTKSVLANNEDGKLYRWDLTTNTLSQTVVLTAGLGEAYTSTLIGPDGKVYATNNAILFAVGQ